MLEQNSLKTAEPLKTIECVFYSLQPASAHTNFRNQIVSMAIFVLMKHNPCLLCVNCIAMANENCAIVEYHRKYSGCTAHSLSTVLWSVVPLRVFEELHLHKIVEELEFSKIDLCI